MAPYCIVAPPVHLLHQLPRLDHCLVMSAPLGEPPNWSASSSLPSVTHSPLGSPSAHVQTVIHHSSAYHCKGLSVAFRMKPTLLSVVHVVWLLPCSPSSPHALLPLVPCAVVTLAAGRCLEHALFFATTAFPQPGRLHPPCTWPAPSQLSIQIGFQAWLSSGSIFKAASLVSLLCILFISS